MSTVSDEILEILIKLEMKLEETGPTNFPKSDKKQFWRVVGRIKRLEVPKEEYIDKAAGIRETLHENRFGKPIPLPFILISLALTALVLVIGNIIYLNDNNDLLTAGIITYLGYIILFSVYFYILNWIFYNEIVTYSIIIVSSAVELVLLYNYFPGFLAWLVKISIFGVVPVLYPYGRWISGKITNIKLDGAIRDIYFLITLKTNYNSYLSAPQNNRHWFFIIPGIGTVFTATLIGIFEWIYYGLFIFLIFAIFLAVAEIYAYIFDVGVWGGELGHARRERMIIKDINRLKTI